MQQNALKNLSKIVVHYKFFSQCTSKVYCKVQCYRLGVIQFRLFLNIEAKVKFVTGSMVGIKV